MKTFTEINAEITENYKGIRAAEEKAKSHDDKARELQKGYNSFKDKNNEDKKELIKAIYIEDEYYTESKKESAYKIAYNKVLQNNAKYVICEYVIPQFVEIFNRYTGKKAGEKTRAKFEAEILEACKEFNCRVHTKSQYGNDGITIYCDTIREYIEIYASYTSDHNARKLYDNDNKFVEVNADWFKNPYEYIENIDNYIQTATQILLEAKQLKKEYEKKQNEYNKFAKYGEIFHSINNNNAHYVEIV